MSFTKTNLNRIGVYPACGGYSLNENDNGGIIEKEFSFSFLMFTQSTDSSGAYYVNQNQAFVGIYSDAKELFLSWVRQNFGQSPIYTDNNINYPLSSVQLSQAEEGCNKWFCSIVFKIQREEEQGSETATPVANPVIGVTDIKYNLGANNTHITRSNSTSVLWSKTGRTAVGYNNRIDFNDGETKGTDIVTPQLNFSITVNYSTLSASNLSNIMAMVGTVNSSTWGTFPAGTVLFRGGDIVAEKWDRNESFSGIYWKANFNFEYSPNTTVTSPEGTTLNKGGFQFIWGKKEKGVSNGVTQEEVVQINAETIYSSSDFSYFNITWE